MIFQALELFIKTPQIKHGLLIGLVAFIMQFFFLVYLKVFYAAISQSELTAVGNLQEVFDAVKNDVQ